MPRIEKNTTVFLSCEKPYSFYFDFIKKYWESDEAQDSSQPLWRICTMARKMGAKTLIIESVRNRSEIREEIRVLGQALGGKGSATAYAVTFFSSPLSDNTTCEGSSKKVVGKVDVSKIIAAADKENIIGQVIIVNYTWRREAGAGKSRLSYIYEASFVIPQAECVKGSHLIPLQNSYISVESMLKIRVSGRKFEIRGVHYAQQNNKTGCCAHACLRMAVNTLPNTLPATSDKITNISINKALFGVEHQLDNLPLCEECEGVGKKRDECRNVNCNEPRKGLLRKEIKRIVKEYKLNDQHYSVRNGLSVGEVKDAWRTDVMPILLSTVDSGYPALLAFSTGIPSDNNNAPQTLDEGGRPDDITRSLQHVVLVFGYTRNTDEWHLPALSMYGSHSESRYYSASAWVDHFLVHDDNLGPYYALSSRSLEISDKVRVSWVLPLYPEEVKVFPAQAERVAAAFLNNIPYKLKEARDNDDRLNKIIKDCAESKWYKYIIESFDKDSPQRYVLKTTLMNRDSYKRHMESIKCHEGNVINVQYINYIKGQYRLKLPNLFWVVEISVPYIFTGNRGKFGEIIVDATYENDEADIPVYAWRLPGAAFIMDVAGKTIAYALSMGMRSHAKIYVKNESVHEW